MELILTFCFFLCLPFFIVVSVFLLKIRALFFAKFRKLIFVFFSHFFPGLLNFFSVKRVEFCSRFPSLLNILKFIFLSRIVFTSINSLIFLFTVASGASVTLPAVCMATFVITLNFMCFHRWLKPIPIHHVDESSKALLQNQAYAWAQKEVTLDYSTKVDTFLKRRDYLDAMLSNSFNLMADQDFSLEAIARHEGVLQYVNAQRLAQDREVEDAIIRRASAIFRHLLDEDNPHKIPPEKMWLQIALLILTALTTLDPPESRTLNDENTDGPDTDAADFS